MEQEVINLMGVIDKKLNFLNQFLAKEQIESRLIQVTDTINNQQDLWSNPQHAKALIKEKNYLEAVWLSFIGLKDNFKAYKELVEYLDSTKEDEALFQEAVDQLKSLEAQVKAKEIQVVLNEKNDMNHCYVQIHAGAGGTESQDWASMLLRMYMRWGSQRGFSVSLMDEMLGDGAGIKSATILLEGDFAFGLMRAEMGVHRLVRISPFDANAKRHTSFASVWAYPVVDENIEIELSESDVRIDTYRAGGAGGQHVNKTDSAVRLTHIKTGIVVQCQQDRSQHRNKALAFSMLRAKLYEYEKDKQLSDKKASDSAKTDIEWGNQIRSYVLQPYRLVKDTRTQLEHTNPDAVLGGDIDRFIEAYLMQTRLATD